MLPATSQILVLCNTTQTVFRVHSQRAHYHPSLRGSKDSRAAGFVAFHFTDGSLFLLLYLPEQGLVWQLLIWIVNLDTVKRRLGELACAFCQHQLSQRLSSLPRHHHSLLLSYGAVELSRPVSRCVNVRTWVWQWSLRVCLWGLYLPENFSFFLLVSRKWHTVESDTDTRRLALCLPRRTVLLRRLSELGKFYSYF